MAEEAALLVSDLHFGKVAHFRKHGIGVPRQPDLENLARLDALLGRFPARRLVLAGDAFHSTENDSLRLFTAWRERHHTLSVELVQGNHDVMARGTYAELGITLLGTEARLGPLAVVHDPADAGKSEDAYYLAGHVHPGARLQTASGGLTLPALVLGDKLGLLPSFGSFTGHAAVDVREARQVLLFSGERVFALPPLAFKKG